jgi:hypothetical protein
VLALGQENHVQIRRTVATAAGAGALVVSGLSLALAGPAVAASSAAPSPVPSTPARVTTPTLTSPPTVAPSAPARSGGAIDIPAGNAGVSSDASGGATSLEVTVLLAGGIALAGGGTVLAFRRRS